MQFLAPEHRKTKEEPSPFPVSRPQAPEY